MDKLEKARRVISDHHIFGFSGWLIKPIGLSEEHWYLDIAPSENDEEISIPLFSRFPQNNKDNK